MFISGHIHRVQFLAVPIRRRLVTMGKTDSRQSFGSFHSEDVEVLIRQSTTEYTRPAIYDNFCHHMEQRVVPNVVNNFEFGGHAKTTLYALDDQWTFINHGAFGATLQPLLEESNLWRYTCESQPLAFFDRMLLPMIVYAIRETATFLNCPPTELVPLPNVTSGLNSVINSIPLLPGDELMCLSVTYGSTKKILQDTCNRSGATLNIVQLPLPIQSEETIVLAVKQALEKSAGKVKAVVLDHITSNTSFCLPTNTLASLCKEAGAMVIVDAAHSMFSQDCTLYTPTTSSKQLRNGFIGSKPPILADVVDVWLTNGHKWMSAPKGCAFMWISPRMDGYLRPAIVSHGYTPGNPTDITANRYAMKGKLLSSYIWDGCRDYSALLTIPSAISLWHKLECKSQNNKYDNPDSTNITGTSANLTTLREYNRRILQQATSMLAEEWNISSEDFAAPQDLRANSPMSLVPLPQKVGGIPTHSSETSDRQAYGLQERLHHEFAIEVPIKCLENRLYVRLSAHVYNTPEDYQRLAHVMKTLI